MSEQQPARLQLTREELQHLQLLQAEALRHDTVRMSLWQRDLQRHERLSAFLDSVPDVEMFVLIPETGGTSDE